MSRRPLLLLAFLAAALLGVGMPGFSSASFVTTSVNSSSVSASNDWTPPNVVMSPPGATVTGTVTVSASASDAETGIASVVIELAPGGTGAWTQLCTATTAPYTCSWATTSVSDGNYDLRARGTDRAGYSTTSATVTTSVVNTARVTLTNPGDIVRGNVPLTATAYNTGQAKANLTIAYRLAGTASWTTICSASGVVTLSCTWSTTTSPVTSDFYDLRAVAVVGTSTYTDVVADVLVDNIAPTVTMTDPGSPLSGTRTFTATATDAESGLARVVLEYAPTGSTTWTPMCTATTTPYSCRFDTTTLADGTYAFRATGTDVAGNVRTSAIVSPRIVNNTVASVSVDDPGAYLGGTVTLTANASSTNGVASVAIQRAPSAGGAFTGICTDTTAPYSCPWDTTMVADGLYDLRAVLTDQKGITLTSAVVTGRRVDNSPLKGADVQATNGGTTVARPDAGDQIVFTYTRQVAPASILAGWTGNAQAVTVRLRDGLLVGLPGTEDVLDVQTTTGAAVNLGSVNLKQSYAKQNKTLSFPSSQMTATVATVNGVPRTSITVTLGTPPVAASTATAAAAMVWTPSTAATSPTGQPCSAAPVTEPGTNDKDF